MKKLKVVYGILSLFLFLTSCIEPEELKILNWNDNVVRWSVVNGGATTPYLWKIHFQKNGSKTKRLIFQSISSPNIEDISIAGDNLLIHCGGSGITEKLIEINMKNVKDFVDDPIKYRGSFLEQTNESYHEPEFIRKDRAEAIKYHLY